MGHRNFLAYDPKISSSITGLISRWWLFFSKCWCDVVCSCHLLVAFDYFCW